MTAAAGTGFGSLLKRLRLAAGLTQDALAERAGVSTRAVSDLERDPTRLPRLETVALLADALGVGPDDRARLLAAARPSNDVPPAVGQVFPQPLTPLIGRTGLVAAIVDLIEQGQHRLVTLTGPGGVGKTRVALAVAGRVGSRFADGPVFVDFSPLRDPDLVPAAIARQLAIDDRDAVSLVERLAAALRRRHLLLVLDNLEHLLPAHAAVRSLLEACPRLVVLGTSRVPLRVRGEREYRVAPLELPEDDATGPVAPAVRLFVERAHDAGGILEPDPATLATTADICRRLDGLPLAIELAAAWTRVLPVNALLARLDQRLPLLVEGPHDLPARQRTMRDTIAWSHDILDPPEQRHFRGLAVFVGGFTIDAAEAVIGSDGGASMLARLAALVDRSLLQRQEASEPRFVMLETLREFAQEQLAAHGESDALCRRHAAFYLVLAERSGRILRDTADPAGAARLERDHGNLRAALAWALAAGEREIALRLAAALWRFWHERGHIGEGRRWLDDALELVAGSSEIDLHLQIDALIGAATLALDQAAYDVAEAHSRQAVSLARESGQASGLAGALTVRGLVARERGQYDEAVRSYDEALAIAQAAGDRLGEGVALAGLGYLRLFEGDTAAGVAAAERGVALLRAAGSVRELAFALLGLAAHLSHIGAHARAEALATEALALFRTLGDSGRVSESLWMLGLAKQFQGQPDDAMALHEENLALRRARGDEHGTIQLMSAIALISLQQGQYARARALLEETLVLLDRFDDRWARSMSLMLLGYVDLATGDPERAAGLIADGAALMQQLGNRLYLPWCLEGMAGVAAARGAWALAGRMWGARDALMETLQLGLPPANPAADARVLHQARIMLGEEAYAAAYAAGQAMSPEEAIDAVRATFPEPPTP